MKAAGLLLIFSLLAPLTTMAQNENSPFGLNLSSVVPWEKGWIFSNIAHHAYAWHPVDEAIEFNNTIPSSQLSNTGYLVEGSSGILSLIWDAPVPITDTFIISWSGQAKSVDILNFKSNLTVLEKFDQSIMVAMNQDTFLFLEILENDMANPIYNIECRLKSEVSTGNFSKVFLDYIKDFKVLRFTHFQNTNNNTIRDWDEIITNNLFQQQVDYRYLPEICNANRSHAWISIPLQASDEFIEHLVDEVIAGFDPGISVMIELSNEVWNPQFSQFHSADSMALSVYGRDSTDMLTDVAYFYGRRSAEIHQLIETRMQEQNISLPMCAIISWQAANPYHLEQTVIPVYRTFRTNGDFQIAIAPFFGNALGEASLSDQVEKFTLEDLFDHLENGGRININNTTNNIGSLLELEAQLEIYSSLAQKIGANLLTYEMGQHLVGVGETNTNPILTSLFISANRDMRMKNIYLKYFEILKSKKVMLTGLFSSHYAFNRFGSWGIKEYLFQETAETPKYQAVLDFKDVNPVTWNDCYYDYFTMVDEPVVSSFTLSPNPASDYINIDVFNEADALVNIYDVHGQVVLRERINQRHQRIDIGNLHKGLYIITIQPKIELQSIKLIKM